MNASFIDPGRFRAELVLEEAAIVPDQAGGHAEDWGEAAVIMAEIVPLRADLRFHATQSIETVTHQITLRFREAVRSGMRFRKGLRTFAIQTVHDPDETGRYLVCRVIEEGR